MRRMAAWVLLAEVFAVIYVWFTVVSSWLNERARKRGEPEADPLTAQIAVYGWILPLALLAWPLSRINNFLFGG
jgi:hypothetical protein